MSRRLLKFRKNLIVKRQFVTFSLRKVTTTNSVLCFLKYDSSPSKKLNLFRYLCIVNALKLYVINSKYVLSLFYKDNESKRFFKFLKSDVILVPFHSIEVCCEFLTNLQFTQFFKTFIPLALSVNGYFVNNFVFEFAGGEFPWFLSNFSKFDKNFMHNYLIIIQKLIYFVEILLFPYQFLVFNSNSNFTKRIWNF